MLQKSAVNAPAGEGGAGCFSNRLLIRDLVLALLAAVFTGLSGGLLLILLVFGWSEAGADVLHKAAAELQLRSLDGQLLQQAPMLKTDVQIDINGMLARVRVEHLFKNPSQSWMEGVYQFPLPETSAVERLRMQIGERVIEGRIEEKGEAVKIYRQARDNGQRASLLKQQRANIFSASLSNIAPGEEIRIVIEFQQQARYTERRFELRLPLVIAPRYIPGKPLSSDSPADHTHSGWALDTDQVEDASQITPPVMDPRNGSINPVSLRVRLDAGLPLQAVTSHYHPMLERVDGEGVVHLRLGEGEVPADRDFLLSWRLQPGFAPRSVLFTDRWQDEEYALLMILPPAPEHYEMGLNRDVIFVVDHSGSMHGPSMEQAKAALRLSIAGLQPTDRFNLIGFNNRSRMLFSSPRPASETTLSRAFRFIDTMHAEGGTEMYPALEKALNNRNEETRLRQIVFLTDGSVGNEQALFDLIRKRLGASRLFTVGIGSAPNTLFMQRAAQYGRGSFTYIGDLNEVASRMQGLFEKLGSPAMSHISVMWQGPGNIDVEPQRLPDLYLSEPLMISLKGERLNGSLALEGRRGNETWKQSVEIQANERATGIHTLWARQRIAGLMALPDNELAEEMKRQRVVDLALKHQIVSPYTSLVAVEKPVARPHSEGMVGGMMPVNLPAGWHAESVFGRLPQTASPAPLLLCTGSLLLLFWIVLGRFKTRGRPASLLAE
ncbi:MAG: marine proteobacterial sortase target protein [Candidatus Thiodiazotropha sp.]